MAERSFENRHDAGVQLVPLLAHLTGQDVLVLGLARGGVEVAAPIAESLGAILTVFVARKLGVPWQPELGFGAVAPEAIVLQHDMIERLGLTPEDVERAVARETAEAHRRLEAYGQERIEAAGKMLVLIDDGLATGVTALAAVRSARALSPAHLVFAAPVCSSQGAAKLRPEVDELICAIESDRMFAVGAYYADFTQTTDEQVQEILAGSAPRAA